MSVRHAKPNDAARIAEINIISWEDTYRGLMPDEIIDNRKLNAERILHYKEKIEEGKNTVLVYENEQGIITGYLWAGKARDNDIKLFDELYAFYVDPKYQGNGYGTKLINKFKTIVKDKHFYLYMLKNNKTHDFYVKVGGVEMKDYTKTMQIGNSKIEEVLYKF